MTLDDSAWKFVVKWERVLNIIEFANEILHYANISNVSIAHS